MSDQEETASVAGSIAGSTREEQDDNVSVASTQASEVLQQSQTARTEILPPSPGGHDQGSRS